MAQGRQQEATANQWQLHQHNAGSNKQPATIAMIQFVTALGAPPLCTSFFCCCHQSIHSLELNLPVKMTTFTQV